MIAVVDNAAKAVWGLGENIDSAMRDAENEIAGKKRFNTALKVGKLEYAQIARDAPLNLDGEQLYQYCIFEQGQTDQQLGLF